MQGMCPADPAYKIENSIQCCTSNHGNRAQDEQTLCSQDAQVIILENVCKEAKNYPEINVVHSSISDKFKLLAKFP